MDRTTKILFGSLVAMLGLFLMAQHTSDGFIPGQAKIDNQTCDGLTGTSNSLCYRINEIERHLHGRERWIGVSADQSGTDWADVITPDDTPNVFTAISGSDTYGADANDEAKIFGTGDTCGTGITGAKLDLHRLNIISASATTTYVLRIVYGSGTMGDAITAGQYSEVTVRRDPGGGENHGTPLPIHMPRITVGTHKLWIQAANTTDNATITFFAGFHCYEG